jgi:hypothetical protein
MLNFTAKQRFCGSGKELGLGVLFFKTRSGRGFYSFVSFLIIFVRGLNLQLLFEKNSSEVC